MRIIQEIGFEKDERYCDENYSVTDAVLDVDKDDFFDFNPLVYKHNTKENFRLIEMRWDLRIIKGDKTPYMKFIVWDKYVVDLDKEGLPDNDFCDAIIKHSFSKIKKDFLDFSKHHSATFEKLEYDQEYFTPYSLRLIQELRS